jgi:iron complex outermembrane receptor protein
MRFNTSQWVGSVCLVFAACASGPLAAAQTPGATDSQESNLEEVVVTGSGIRGAPPVGSNLITVGHEAI